MVPLQKNHNKRVNLLMMNKSQKYPMEIYQYYGTSPNN